MLPILAYREQIQKLVA
jgi:ATP-dependent RNA helicase DHX8/PRP22